MLEEVQNMREFYQEQLKDQPMKLAAHLGQGCFTHDFLAVLLTNTLRSWTMTRWMTRWSRAMTRSNLHMGGIVWHWRGAYVLD